MVIWVLILVVIYVPLSALSLLSSAPGVEPLYGGASFDDAHLRRNSSKKSLDPSQDLPRDSKSVIDGGKQVYEFDEFQLDVIRRQLSRSGEIVPLYSKAFDLLLVLVEKGGTVLTKDELLEAVWPGQILEEANLTVTMSVVRKALGERASQPRYIVTIPGRGYRFAANFHEPREADRGLVIESQTISEITVEEVEGDDGETID